MKQVVRKGLKEIVVDEVPAPFAPPNHVLVQPVFSLISSGTETASIHQEGVLREVAENPSHVRKVWEVMKVQGPVRTLREVHAKLSEYAVLGYAGSGLVVDKHPTVRDLEIGDRVAYGGEGTGHAEVVVTGRNLVARLPDGVGFEQAVFTTLGSIAMNAVRTAAIGLGDVVAVVGMGLVGQLVSQLVQRQGGIVIAIDPRQARVELARRLGASHDLDGGAGTVEAVRALTGGRGADCVVVAAAARSSAPARLALDLCRDRGSIVVVGAVELSFPWHEMYLKEIRLLMARAYGPGSYDAGYERGGHDYPFAYVRWTENRNMAEFLRLLAAGQVRVEPLISHEFPLERAPEAYATILDRSSGSLAVLLRYPAAERPSSAETPPAPVFRRRAEIRPAAAGPLQVALVGAGNLARWAHLPNVARMPGVALRAVYSTSGVRGKSYGLRFGAAYCTTDLDELLADPEVQVVVVASRNQEHAGQALAALRAGKHVFVEKPMALTQDECRALARAVEERDVTLTVGFNRRFAPAYLGLKEALARRTSPAIVSCRVHSPGISGGYWMADPAIGGAILGEACHFADLMHWLLESEPVAVSAFCLPAGTGEPIGQNNLVASFRFADGSVGNLTYCTVGSRTSAGERVEVFAPGVAAVTENFTRLALLGSGRRERRWWRIDKGYATQMRRFVEAVRTGREPDVTVRDGTRATLACLAMLESARRLGPCAIGLDAASR